MKLCKNTEFIGNRGKRFAVLRLVGSHFSVNVQTYRLISTAAG